MVTFTEEILNGNFIFCAVSCPILLISLFFCKHFVHDYSMKITGHELPLELLGSYWKLENVKKILNWIETKLSAQSSFQKQIFGNSDSKLRKSKY